MLRACLLTSVLLVVAACSSDTGASDAGSPGSPAPDEPEAETAPYVGVGFGPVGLAADDDGSVWVVAARDETLARIPAGADEPDLTVDVPGVPLRVAAAYGAVWVTSFDAKSVARVDPTSGEVVATIRTGAGPEGVAAGF